MTKLTGTKCLEFPNKKRYSTKKQAEKVLILNDKDLKIYECETCKGWHLSSK